uniref:Prolactin regulatory element-binding protein n=1 Tax=Tetraselmis sp. GSL018 TaxID=582737 RepID=A0A061R5G7_9CHLO
MESQKNKKFGCPLYSAAWASPSCVVLAGGGGKKTSGIKNKILAVPVRNGALEEETLACSTGETEFDVPYRLLLHPDLAGGLVAMAGSGGCRSVEVARAPDGTLSSIALGTEGTAACKRLTADTGVSRICFGGRRMDSAFLGLEDGRVLVLSYPTLELKGDFATAGSDVKPDDRGVKDMDVAPASVGPMLVAASDGGKGTVWHWPSGKMLAELEVPPGLKPGRGYSGCRFARDTDDMFGEPNTVYAVVNSGGTGSVVAWQWGQGAAEDLDEALRIGWSKARVSSRLRVANDPITCMEISPSGRWIAAGTSEGDLVVCRTGRLSCVKRVRQAHMVFATALAWSPDGSQVVSVSGDASAYLVQAPPPPGLLQRPEVQVILALLILLVAVLLRRLPALSPGGS